MALRLFAQPLDESNNKENIRAPHNRLIVRRIYRWLVTFSIISLVLKHHIIVLVFGLADLVVAKQYWKHFVFDPSRLVSGASEAILREQPYAGVRPANERRRYKVTPSLTGWAHT